MPFGTGGATGISFKSANEVASTLINGVGQPLAPLRRASASPRQICRRRVRDLLLLVVAACYWLLKRTGESPFGRVLKAIREDEDVANALGKNTDRFKIKSFMLGCALMGLAGVLFRGQAGYVSPSSSDRRSRSTVAALTIGGSGSNTGSIIGAATFSGLLSICRLAAAVSLGGLRP